MTENEVPFKGPEDDIAKAKLGPQGVPGKPDKPPIADEDELQLPKALDPGHTA